MTLLGILLLVLVGVVLFNVRFEGNLFSLLAGISLGAFAFFALGYALVGLVPSARAVVVIGNVVLYPLMIFSGAMVPLEVMPETVRTISRYLLRERMGGSPDRGGRAGRCRDPWNAYRGPDFSLGIRPYSAPTGVPLCHPR
jgi:hypothetical protein